MMSVPYLCIDASVGAKWVLSEEYEEQALALYTQHQDAQTIITVPPHFPVEVTNAIRRRIARRLITHAEGLETLRAFSRFTVRLSMPDGLYEDSLDLAETFNRPTVYDMHYVALAKLLGCELWTADESLLRVLGNSAPYVRWIRDYPI